MFSVTIFIKLPVIAQTAPTQAGQLIQQGQQLYNAKQFTDAISIWQEAIKILPDNSLNKAMALSNLSLSYQQLGEWQKAEESVTQSLNILQSLKATTEQQRILAQTLDIQGNLFYQTGQSQAALNTWQQSYKIHLNLVDQKNNQINQAQAMQNLGLYPRACQTLLEILDLDEQKCNISTSDLADIKQEILNNPHQYYKIKALRSLGSILGIIGDLQLSQIVLETNLEIIQSLQGENLSQEESKILLDLGNTEQAIAKRALAIGNITQSNIYQQKALEHYQKAVNLTASARLKTQINLNQFSLLMSQEQWTKAEDLLGLIVADLTKLPVNRDTLYAKIHYAKNFLCLKQKDITCLNAHRPHLHSVDELSFNQAIQLLENTAQQAKQIQDKRTLSYIEGMLGRLYESRQKWQEAEQYTQQALYSSWQTQAPELTYQWQWQQARLLKAQGKDKESLQMYQQTIQTLQSLRGDLVAINPEIQFTFRESIEPIYREYVSLLLQKKDNETVPQDNLQLARQTIDSLQLAELENFFKLVCLDARPVIIDQVTDQNDPSAAVIYPILLEDRFEIILKLPQQNLGHYTTPISNFEEVNRILTRLQQSLTQVNSQETLPLAQQIYDWMLRPIEKDLAQSQIKTLVFVLDSALRNIPMSVLHNGQNYLVEQYSIALVPSLQLIDPQPLRTQQSQALVAGLSESSQVFAPLPYVEQEIQEIRSQIPNSTQLLNQTFTNINLKNAINSVPFSVVHIATHGQFSSQAEETFIVTWDDRLNVHQLNDLLRLREADQLGAIELLVLSACETLVGDERASLGLAGVAVRAGARSTLATLWQVNDQATAKLMSQFYTALQDSTATKAEALRQAQRVLINDPNYNRPYFWAAYVLLGNWL